MMEMDSRTQRDEQNFCLPSESDCETFYEKGFFKIPSNKLVSARKILPQESFGKERVLELRIGL